MRNQHVARRTSHVGSCLSASDSRLPTPDAPRYITVVPAIRTIPGVEEFDYAVADSADVRPGDLIRVPFRSKEIPAFIIRRSSSSAVAEKAKDIGRPVPLLHFGDSLATLLCDAAVHSFCAMPSVLLSWIRTVPKRLPTPDVRLPTCDSRRATPHTLLPTRETRFLLDRWNGPRGLIEAAKNTTGRTLILTPWQHRADALSAILQAPAIHAGVTDGTAWRSISGFVQQNDGIIIATRLGAWLAAEADTILIDEPENDDFKSDELSPRLDARWIVSRCAELRPTISVIEFATTPRLRSATSDVRLPTPDLQLSREVWGRRSGSQIEHVSPRSVQLIDETIGRNQTAVVIHPVRGERSRLACRDCGWTAVCAFCGFHLSHVGSAAICKRCGRRGTAPDACASCGGTDLSRGQPGTDRLAAQLKSYFNSDLIRIMNPMEFDGDFSSQILRSSGRQTCTPDSRLPTPDSLGLLIITDLSLIGGIAEDIRKKERLLIAWRRIAAAAASSGSHLHVQGPENLIDKCATWLTPDGVAKTWQKELEERRAFSYPPSVRLAKMLIDGAASIAEGIAAEVTAAIPAGWSVRGPFPVAFRSYTRTLRHALHVIAPPETLDADFFKILGSFRSRALIDLDPIAFFM